MTWRLQTQSQPMKPTEINMSRRTRRTLFTVGAVSSLALFAGTNLAMAGQATGSTSLLGAPTHGAQVDVDVAIVSAAPVVAFEYSIRNECRFPGSKGGRIDSTQTDPIVNWVYSSSNATIPHATMPIYLVTVPINSRCTVFLMKDNVVVKGSLTSYSVL
jgi:hypothetical protein